MPKNEKTTQPRTARDEEAEGRDPVERLDVEPRLAESVRSWLRNLGTAVAEHEFAGRTEHVGRIVRVADGVATVSGLPQARFNELLRFPGDVYGLVFNLDPDTVGCVLLGEETRLSAGDPVRLTGAVVVVPVGEAFLGRVVDALGRPLDGEGAIDAERTEPVESEAPPILDRLPVEQQLITGIKTVDSMIAIGRGQRELIVGDRAVGKTALAVDTILSQRGTDVICIYVAVGQKVSTVKRVTESLRRQGVMRQCLVVCADADDPPGLQFIAPYAATTMGEHFMRKGRDVLIIYDDLTRHARAYREMSLLLRRPPGREAYPGDIFFIHSRLLERATRLKEEAGGGSLTAMPIVETQAKNLSAYIPTNLISITDGQIFLDPDLFYKGIKPAIDVGKSVSRVGGKTQRPAIRSVVKQLRLEYAQFAELEVFTRFGATVEEKTQKKIDRGRRIREVLKQGRLDPLTAAEQVIVFLSVDRGVVDRIAIEKLAAFQRALRETVPPKHDELVEKIEQGEELQDSDWEALAESIEKVAAQFVAEKEEAEDEEPGAEAAGAAAAQATAATPDSKSETESDAGHRQIEKQLRTIEGLRDIIHSMRSLAATYLSRAEERLEGVRAYADTIGRAIEDCLFGRDIRLPESEAKGAAILVFFSEQGLCGRFNEVMAEAAARHAREVESPRFIAVGKRGPALLRREKLPILADLPSTTSPDGVDAIIHQIAKAVLSLHGRGAFERLYLLHARYLSPGRIEPRLERVLPLDLTQWRGTEDRRRAAPRLAMSRVGLLWELIGEYTFISVYRAFTESLAGENGMRLQSMEAARNNIDETLSDLQLQARIQRQNEITEELLDVVSGAEALRAS